MARTTFALISSVVVMASTLAGCGGSSAGPLWGQGDDSPLPLLERTKKSATRTLSSEAEEVAKDNGFVIVPAATAPSFHFGYSALFEKDQPVYITADAVLHSLHASFDDILIDIEHHSLIPELDAFLDETRKGLPAHTESSAETRADVDLFLAVAKSLLQGKPAAPVAGAAPEQINKLTQLAIEAGSPAPLELFGTKVDIDFSMMKPRGHYTGSEQLKRYFRALSWLGRVELRIAEKEGAREFRVNRGALAATQLLVELMTPRARTAWGRLDRATQLLVGPPDSMSLPQFSTAAKEMTLSWTSVDSIEDKTVVDKLRPLAEQRINTQLLTPYHKTIPLWVFGQRYIADSHVLSATSYGGLQEKRMMPSALDVGAAVFGNPEADKLLAPDYERYASLRPAVDRVGKQLQGMGPELWHGSMSHLWLEALRDLSQSSDSGLPAMMKKPAWNRRLLNTQLASWAERRHDTILYAKQSVTAIAGCSFPKAYVDPYPRFYERLIAFAKHGQTVVADLDLKPAQKKHMHTYFTRMAEVMGTLRDIAKRERAGQPMTDEHLDFINHAVSVHGSRVGSGSDIAYTIGGWMAELYYKNESAKFHKPTIVDVHTQPTDEVGNPVGKVLHVATGRPQLIEVRLGPEQTYRGFVSSYHEVVTSGFERLDDAWMAKEVRSGRLHPMPWLSEFAPE